MGVITEYDFLMTAKEYCEVKAQEYAAAEDTYLTQFYRNAAEGFNRRAAKLSVTAASKVMVIE